MTSLWPGKLQEKNENFKNSVVWGCKQAAKISIRLEYSNRMLVRELNWKKIVIWKNLQVHKILKGKIFFGKYARNGLLGGEIIK